MPATWKTVFNGQTMVRRQIKAIKTPVHRTFDSPLEKSMQNMKIAPEHGEGIRPPTDADKLIAKKKLRAELFKSI